MRHPPSFCDHTKVLLRVNGVTPIKRTRDIAINLPRTSPIALLLLDGFIAKPPQGVSEARQEMASPET